MKKNLAIQWFKVCFIWVIFVLPISAFAQSTFTVVCDKSDNTVKVVESSNRSPNYVPIKGGFPFKQVAQKWINENYHTTDCNPQDILKDIQKKKKTAPANNQNVQPVSNQPTNTAHPQGNVFAKAPAKQINRNTSFLAAGKFSTLGEAFSLNEKLMYGFGFGIEQVFGGQAYFGTGINVDFFLSEMDGYYNINKETIYLFKIPIFIGYRTSNTNITAAWEAGATLNSKLTGTELTLESFGQTPKNYSANFLARMKVGTEKVMLELGAETGLTEVFEYDDYKMTVVYIGLRMNF